MTNKAKGPIRVLIVDDSPSVQEFLRSLIDREPDMLVVETVSGARQAIESVKRFRPDLITMDVEMPGQDGIQATSEIMRHYPTPVAVVTAAPVTPSSDATFRALSAGAVDVLAKPNRSQFIQQPELRDAFMRQLRNVARVGVVGIRGAIRASGCGNESRPLLLSAPISTATAQLLPETVALIAIGASTGGPPVIRCILSALEPDETPPILVVQHIGSDFVSGFVEWLNESIALKVVLAEAGTKLQPGHVYIAPGDRHMIVGADLRLLLDTTAPVHYQRPSIDTLFASVAERFGKTAVGVLLTGMGEDGAEGMGKMFEQGALTVAQNEESCVVYGMPKVALESGAARLSATPDAIGRLLRSTRSRAGRPISPTLSSNEHRRIAGRCQ